MNENVNFFKAPNDRKRLSKKLFGVAVRMGFIILFYIVEVF